MKQLLYVPPPRFLDPLHGPPQEGLLVMHSLGWSQGSIQMKRVKQVVESIQVGPLEELPDVLELLWIQILLQEIGRAAVDAPSSFGLSRIPAVACSFS